MAGITDQQYAVLASKDGYFLKIQIEDIPMQKKTARGVHGMKLSAKDELEAVFTVRSGEPCSVTFHDKNVDLARLRASARGGRGSRR